MIFKPFMSYPYKAMILNRNNIISLIFKSFLLCSIEFLVFFYYKNTILYSFLDATHHVLQLNPHCLIRFLSYFDKIISDFSRQSLLSLHMTKSYVRTATRSTLKVEANLTQILNFKAKFHTEFEPFFKKKNLC